MRYANFHGVNAKSSNFANALFQNAELELAKFEVCNFEGVSFASAALKSARFEKCNISGARFEGADGLEDDMMRDAWAWRDRPPRLPTGIVFRNYFEQGPNGEYRDAYRKMLTGTLEFGPPE